MSEWVSEWVSVIYHPTEEERKRLWVMEKFCVPTHSHTHITCTYMYVCTCIYWQLHGYSCCACIPDTVSRLTTQSCLNVFVNEFFIITHTYTRFYVYNGVSACQKSCLVVLTLLLICSDFMRDCFETEPNWAVKLMKRTALMSSCN